MLCCFTGVATSGLFVSQDSYYISYNGQRAAFDPQVDVRNIYQPLSERQSFDASILKLKEKQSDSPAPLSLNAIRRGDEIIIGEGLSKGADLTQIYQVRDLLITRDNRIRLADVIGYDNPLIIVTKTKMNGWDGKEDSYLVVITTKRSNI